MKYRLFHHFWILVVSMFSLNSYADNAIGQAALETEQLLNQFLHYEYKGEVDQRMKSAAMYKKGKLLYGNTLSERTFPGIILCIECDPVVPTLDYKIINSEIKNPQHAVYTVRFNVLGKTIGDWSIDNGDWAASRELIFNTPVEETVDYKIDLTDQGWKIVEPALPHISLEALKEPLIELTKKCKRMLNDASISQETIEWVTPSCTHYEAELEKIKDQIKHFEESD